MRVPLDIRRLVNVHTLCLFKEEGIQGGVVLIDPVSGGESSLTGLLYYYTDIFLIYAIRAGLVPGCIVTPEMSSRVDHELKTGPGSDSFHLNKAFFVRALNPECLLALLGLQSRYSSSWRLNVLRYLSTDQETRLAAGEKEEWQQLHAKEIDENLRQLVHVSKQST